MRKIFLLIVALFFIVECVCWAEDINTTLEFSRANAAYKGGDYLKAVGYYEGIINAGFENGDVYYNLGNTYFKLNQLGKTILSYERAKRFIPRDSNLAFNGKYALSLVKNYGEVPNASLSDRLLSQYADNFTVNEITWVVFLTLVLLGGIYFLSLYQKWPKIRSMIFFSILGFIFILNIFALTFKVYQENHQAIVIQETESKYEPNERATNYFQLSEGSKVIILKKEDDWWKVKRLDGKIGWIKKEIAEKI